MMKIKHNKKRNTAFVYEALVRETTAAILKGDDHRKTTALGLIEKHFKPDSILRKDLECYQSLTQNQALEADISQRIIKEAAHQRKLLSSNELFKKQSELIKDINVELAPSVFGNFVPNYKYLATIAQMFSQKNAPRSQIMLENEVIKQMTSAPSHPQEMVKIDNVIYKTFVDKFNLKYNDELLSEQKDLLTYYISSFSDNAVELKMFLNEEIQRLKVELEKASHSAEISLDPDMTTKTSQIINKLDTYSDTDINESVLLTVLKTQQLVKEIYSNVNNS